MPYIIMGTYHGNTEEVDEAETRKEALYLLGEYRLGFGPEWSLRIKYIPRNIPCSHCEERAIIRKTLPSTADKANAKYFDYFYCSHCKVNTAKEKE
jgi:hypothetical protein